MLQIQHLLEKNEKLLCYVLLIFFCCLVFTFLVVLLYFNYMISGSGSRPNCKIIGNPRWNHYCRRTRKTDLLTRCNTGCGVRDTPIGAVCCTSECCEDDYD